MSSARNVITLPKKRTGFLFIRGIDGDLKNRFKAYCSRRGSNMTREIENMIRNILGPGKEDGDIDGD